MYVGQVLLPQERDRSLPSDRRSYVGSKTLVQHPPLLVSSAVREVLTYTATGFLPQTAVFDSVYGCRELPRQEQTRLKPGTQSYGSSPPLRRLTDATRIQDRRATERLVPFCYTPVQGGVFWASAIWYNPPLEEASHAYRNSSARFGDVLCGRLQ
jgi:hypothetical protein